MYPDFKYLLQALTGAEMPEWLSLFKTFGFLMALSFLAAAWATGKELKRKAQQGLLQPQFQTVTLGLPMTQTELWASIFTGFLLGFKIGGIFGNFATVSPDPMGYLFSTNGNFVAGILVAAIMGYLKYAEKKKEQLPEPVVKQIKVYPHERVTEIIVIGAVAGLAGAKIFNAFETWDDFIQDPIRSLTSSSGLTFLGGLIVATISFYFYARQNKIPFKHLCDATAPAIMLAYGLGRLGCQFSGDGDWGIFNTAYIANPDGSMRLSTPADAQYIKDMVDKTPFTNITAPSWLPDWLLGMTYPHNVGHEGMPIQGCVGEYCNVLPVSVFPTPIYEFFACVTLFFVMWALRKKMIGALKMFGLYLILAGIERFLVERIRVNYEYDWGFIHPSQAEILSVVMVITGLFLMLVYKDKETASVKPEKPLNT